MNNFTIDMIIGIFLFYTGYTWLTKSPQDWKNSNVGYRTKRALKNDDTWNEAQKYASKLMMAFAVIYTTIGFFIRNLKGITGFLIVLFVIVVLLPLIVYIPTEMHLKKIFDKDGNRK